MGILVIFVVNVTVCSFHIDLCLMDRPYVAV